MRLSILLLVTLLLLITPAWAGQPLPIQIESDRMESGESDNTIIFTGGVVARQGDLVVHSDRMIIIYLGDEEKARLAPDSAQRLKKLTATGNVKLETAAWIGTGARMDYFEIERKVYLTGNAKVWQGNNLVTGEAVTIYLDEGKSIVERSEQPGERVRAFFYSGNEHSPQPPPGNKVVGPESLPGPGSTPLSSSSPVPVPAPAPAPIPNPAGE